MELKPTSNSTETNNFKSSYLLRLINGSKIAYSADKNSVTKIKLDGNPFRPIHLKLTPEFIEYRRREWHLFSVDKTKFHWQNIIGISIEKHFIGCHIKIMSSGSDDVFVHGFSKRKANQIYSLASARITTHSQKSTKDALSEVIITAFNNSKEGQISVADEIKKMKALLDEGIITQQEFYVQKQKLMNS